MATEDLTTYTEYDEGSSISVSSDTVTLTSCKTREDTGYVYKDFGADYFDGDFEVTLDVNFSSFDLLQWAGVFAVSNAVDDYKRSSNEIYVRFYKNATGTTYIALYEQYDAGSSYAFDHYSGGSATDAYYLTIKRVMADSTYGTVYCYIYSDSDRTILVDTLSKELHSEESYRYLYTFFSYDDNNNSDSVSGTISNVEIQDVSTTAAPTTAAPTTLGPTTSPPCSDQDLTTYTEVDPGSDLSIITSQVSISTLRARNNSTYVYYDFGADYFDGDFEVQFSVYLSLFANSQILDTFVLANEVGDSYSRSGNELSYRLQTNGSGNQTANLRERYSSGASTDSDSGTILSKDNVIYYTIKRDSSVGTYGTLYCFVYSDSARNNLSTTFSVRLHSAESYRYLYILSAYNDGANSNATSGQIDDLKVCDAIITPYLPPTTGAPTTLATTTAPTTAPPTTLAPTDAPNPNYENFALDYTHVLDTSGGRDPELEVDITQHIITMDEWWTLGCGNSGGYPAYDDYIYRSRYWDTSNALADEFDLNTVEDADHEVGTNFHNARGRIWMLSTMPGTPTQIRDAGGKYISLRYGEGGTYTCWTFTIDEFNGVTEVSNKSPDQYYGSPYDNDPVAITCAYANSWTRVKIDIDYDDPTAPFGTFRAFIGNAVGPGDPDARTISLALRENYIFRYFTCLASSGRYYPAGRRQPLGPGETWGIVRNYELAEGGGASTAPPTCPPTTTHSTEIAETIPCCTIIPRTFAPGTDVPRTKVIPLFKTCCDFKGQAIIGNLF